MSYSNGILGWSGDVSSSEKVIVKGEKGDPGIGFKLTSDGNYDLQNKKVFNLDTPDDHKVDDDYNTKVQDLKSAVNKEYLNDKFLKKDKDGNYFDARQMVIENTEPYYDGLYDNNDLVSKAYVDAENSKHDIATADEANKSEVLLHDGFGNFDMKDHTITGIRSSSQDNSAVTLGDVEALFLPRDGGRPMSGNLDMGGNTVNNIRPFVENDKINQSGQVID